MKIQVTSVCPKNLFFSSTPKPDMQSHYVFHLFAVSLRKRAFRSDASSFLPKVSKLREKQCLASLLFFYLFYLKNTAGPKTGQGRAQMYKEIQLDNANKSLEVSRIHIEQEIALTNMKQKQT